MIQFLSPTKVLNPKPGWYRGDFHVHSNFSDGALPPHAVMETAKSEGLDFFVLTDHNRIDSLAELVTDPQLLVIPGMEVTLTKGHFNVIGIRDWQSWMEDICVYPYQSTHPWKGNNPSTSEMMAQSSRHGLINSIAHPLMSPWEWLDYQTNLNYVQCIEICTCPGYLDSDIATPKAIKLWTELLNAGYRITGVGGSDYHRSVADHKYREPERLGFPTTYVFAEELSWNAIISAVLRRRAYVSLEPVVSFESEANGKLYDIGQDIGLFDGDIKLDAEISQCSDPAYAQIVRNGEVIAEETFSDGKTRFQYTDVVSSSDSTWYRLDVYDSNGSMLAITNPIFVGRRKHPQMQTYGEILELAFPKNDTQD